MNKAPLSDSDILAIIANELSTATYSTGDDSVGHLETSMSYYLGRPNGTEVVGRSTVVSTDVADTIEWIMPQIMESFTQVNEIVKFDPIGPNDFRQAELESQFCYDVLMKDNDGFVLIYELVKDALMQRNGVLKIYYDKNNEREINKFTGLTEEGLAVLVSNGYDVISLSTYLENDIEYYDTTVEKLCSYGKINIDSVPLEEFRLSAHHNSIDANKARFTAHSVAVTISDLIEEGYDEAVLNEVPGYHEYNSDYRWAMMDENGQYVDSEDPSLALLQKHECIMRIDIDGSGVAKTMKITCVGSDNEPAVILSKEHVNEMPWVTTTPIIMPHKFQGLSIYDRLKQIQDHKTAIWRNILDNMYLQNNQRYAVIEGQVEMRDLLVSRPGGVVRTKRLDAIKPLETPQMSNVAFDMMRYLDEVRAGRSGVQADGNASPVAIGDRVGSQGVDRLLNAKEALVGLIIRTIAETGIKPLMVKIRNLLLAHQDAVQDYEFRGEWIQIAPQSWVKKRKCTVKVGTGTGDSDKKLAALQSILQVQTTAIQNPQQVLVDQTKIFSTLDDICKLSGLNSATRYFIDPATQEGQQKQQLVAQQAQEDQQKQEQATIVQLQNEAKIAESAVTSANAQLEATRYRSQNEQLKLKLEAEKAAYQTKLAELEQQLNEYKTGMDGTIEAETLAFKREELDKKLALEYDKLNKEIPNNIDNSLELEQMRLNSQERIAIMKAEMDKQAKLEVERIKAAATVMASEITDQQMQQTQQSEPQTITLDTSAQIAAIKELVDELKQPKSINKSDDGNWTIN